jgi:ankyrin repeat protein
MATKIIENEPKKVFHEIFVNQAYALELIKTPEGIKLLIDAKDDNGWTGLHKAVKIYKSVALELIKTPEGLKYLADVKNNLGVSALCIAIENFDMSIKILGLEGGIKLCANTKDFFGHSVFTEIISKHEKIALDLIKTKKGLRYLLKIKDNNGRTALHEAIIHHESVALECIKTAKGRKLLTEIKDNYDYSIMDLATYNYESIRNNEFIKKEQKINESKDISIIKRK